MKCTISVVDLFDLFLAYTRISTSRFYQIFLILVTKSQSVRNLGPAPTRIRKALKAYVLLRLFAESVLLSTSIEEMILSLSRRHHQSYSIKSLFIYPDNDDWILSGIAKDFVEHISNAEAISFRRFKKLHKQFQGLIGCNFYFMHYDLYVRFSDKFPSSRSQSIVYVPHIRIVTNLLLHKLMLSKGVFCQSDNDQIRLIGLGLSFGHVLSLPVGFDPKNFPLLTPASSSNKAYDLCISMPFRFTKRGSHYWKRKNTDYVSNLVKELSFSYTVLIIGEGWEYSDLTSSGNICIVNPSYPNKFKWLTQAKLFISFSLIEGGPVSLLEAIASGCKVLGYNTGLMAQMAHDFPERVFSIPVSSDPAIAIAKVHWVLDQLPSPTRDVNRDYDKLLRKYSFKSLTRILESFF